MTPARYKSKPLLELAVKRELYLARVYFILMVSDLEELRLASTSLHEARHYTVWGTKYPKAERSPRSINLMFTCCHNDKQLLSVMPLATKTTTIFHTHEFRLPLTIHNNASCE